MVVEQALLNYGVLGLWTITLLANQYIFHKELTKAIHELGLIIKTRIR